RADAEEAGGEGDFLGDEREEVVGGLKPLGKLGVDAERVIEPGEQRIDRAELGVVELFPEDHQGDAVGESREVKERAVSGHAAEFLAEQHGQEQRSGNRQREAEHEIERVDEEDPEIDVGEHPAEILKADEREGGGMLEIPVGECGDERENDRSGGEKNEAEEIGQEKANGGKKVGMAFRGTPGMTKSE